MGSFSLVHWLILAVVLVLVLGGGRFSNMMGDVAKGIKQFKKGMAEEDEVPVGRRLETQKQAEPAFDADGRARDAVPLREAAPLRDADRVREDR